MTWIFWRIYVMLAAAKPNHARPLLIIRTTYLLQIFQTCSLKMFWPHHPVLVQRTRLLPASQRLELCAGVTVLTYLLKASLRPRSLNWYMENVHSSSQDSNSSTSQQVNSQKHKIGKFQNIIDITTQVRVYTVGWDKIYLSRISDKIVRIQEF